MFVPSIETEKKNFENKQFKFTEPKKLGSLQDSQNREFSSSSILNERTEKIQ